MSGSRQITNILETSNMNNRVSFRSLDRPTTSDHGVSNKYKSLILGWFSNKYNPRGWVITKLSSDDKKWVRENGINTNDVFRSFSDNGNTSLVKINTKTGTYAFADNEHLENTDELKFDKASKFTKMYIDNISGVEKEFGIK